MNRGEREGDVMPDRSTGEIELTVPPVDNVLDLHGDPCVPA